MSGPKIVTEQNWRLAAACRGMDPDLFFPPRGKLTAPARAVCEGCPVREECLRYALDNDEDDGVWGGVSEQDRRVMQNRTRAHGPRPRPIEHGTPHGYQTHIRRGETACEPCRSAHTLARQVRREAAA